MTDAEAIRDAVLAHYLETGMYVDTRGIAKRLGWSESKVRRVLAANFGSVNGTKTYRASVQKYSKNYPNMQAGCATTWVYEPSLSFIAEKLVEARAALAAKGT